jgi:hypothetical protein
MGDSREFHNNFGRFSSSPSSRIVTPLCGGIHQARLAQRTPIDTARATRRSVSRAPTSRFATGIMPPACPVVRDVGYYKASRTVRSPLPAPPGSPLPKAEGSGEHIQRLAIALSASAREVFR